MKNFIFASFLILTLLVFTSCQKADWDSFLKPTMMTNKEIVTEMKYCKDSGLEGRVIYSGYWNPIMVVCENPNNN